MKVFYEEGDVVSYEDKLCLVTRADAADQKEITINVSGTETIVQSSALRSFESYTLKKCIAHIDSFANWVHGFSDGEDHTLEAMSPENYGIMLGLQNDREKLSSLFVTRNQLKLSLASGPRNE